VGSPDLFFFFFLEFEKSSLTIYSIYLYEFEEPTVPIA